MTTITLERAFMIRVLEQLDVAQSLLERSQHHAKIAAMYEELRAALAAPATAPEPVAWMSPKRFYRTRAMALTNGEQLIEPLYLHPPATAPAQPEIVDLLAEMYELILANKVVLAEKSGGVWTWPDRAIEAVRKHRSGPARPGTKHRQPEGAAHRH